MLPHLQCSLLRADRTRETNPIAEFIRPSHIKFLRKYYREVYTCFPAGQNFLLFAAVLDEGIQKTVFIDPRDIIGEAAAKDPQRRDLNRQAQLVIPEEEWEALLRRYVRVSAVN